MQNVSGETFDAVSVRKSLSKLSDFQSVTASPYRVLHQAQGDKQKINHSCCNLHGKQTEVHTIHILRNYSSKMVYFCLSP